MKTYVILGLVVVGIITAAGIFLNLGNSGPVVSSSPSKSSPAPARTNPSQSDNFKF